MTSQGNNSALAMFEEVVDCLQHLIRRAGHRHRAAVRRLVLGQSTAGPCDTRPVTAGEKATRLVLWDIDHTLIDTRGVLRWSFHCAFQAAAGLPLTNQVDLTGQTKLSILDEAIAASNMTGTRSRFRSPAAARLWFDSMWATISREYRP